MSVDYAIYTWTTIYAGPEDESNRNRVHEVVRIRNGMIFYNVYGGGFGPSLQELESGDTWVPCRTREAVIARLEAALSAAEHCLAAATEHTRARAVATYDRRQAEAALHAARAATRFDYVE